ncbi:hypothetical protein [Rhizobium leguminosarum]|uniref:Uncharacterized protein n=1 Tax=Rhizobium leguminosarum TaxID=384 RepID=A0A1B1CBB4_RHILE|nr:hypothetical protein [Rhizobium leguminosarum]ANP87047.1 hypothetical protein BA011_15815 [Rhizobium leguminosarum]
MSHRRDVWRCDQCASDPAALTDLERAARFTYLQKAEEEDLGSIRDRVDAKGYAINEYSVDFI